MVNGKTRQGLRTYLRVAPPPKVRTQARLSGTHLNALVVAAEISFCKR